MGNRKTASIFKQYCVELVFTSTLKILHSTFNISAPAFLPLPIAYCPLPFTRLEPFAVCLLPFAVSQLVMTSHHLKISLPLQSINAPN